MLRNLDYRGYFRLLMSLGACDESIEWLVAQKPPDLRAAICACPSLSWLDWATDHLFAAHAITNAEYLEIRTKRKELMKKLSHYQNCNGLARAAMRIHATIYHRNTASIYAFHIKQVKAMLLAYIEG